MIEGTDYHITVDPKGTNQDAWSVIMAGPWDRVVGRYRDVEITDGGTKLSFAFEPQYVPEGLELTEEFENYLTIGSDYTFDVGNGLNLTMEYFRYQGQEENNYIALALNYPFGLMNRMVAAVYYQWDNKSWYRFLSLQRDYDYWSFHLIGFWNPEQVSALGTSEERTLFAGSGMQLMATVNF